MIRGFYVGARSAVEFQKAMDVTANNLSNVNTNGFKSSRLSFKDILYTRVRMPEDYEQNQRRYDRNVTFNRSLWGYMPPPVDEDMEDIEQEAGVGEYFTEDKLRNGGGMKAIESALNMSQGSLEHTGELLHAVIEGDGFFCVRGLYETDGEWSYYYTRDGSFRISAEDDGNYLVTSAGEYVMNSGLDRILIPEEALMPYIILDNIDNISDDVNEVPVGVFICNNIYGLELTGGNKFQVTEFSGGMESVISVNVRSGYVEMSNVSLAEEMAKVIQYQRAFQANLTIIKTADEIEAYANQLRT